MTRRFAGLAIVTLMLCGSGAVLADVTLPSLFSDHAVLQDRPG